MRGTSTGDPTNDARNAERIAFFVLLRSMNRLAATPLTDTYACERARRRIRAIRPVWWAALMARDEADGFSNFCGGVDASAPAESGVTEQSPPHETQQGLATPDKSKDWPVGNVAKPEGSLSGRTAAHLPERPSHSAGLAPGPQKPRRAVDHLMEARPL